MSIGWILLSILRCFGEHRMDMGLVFMQVMLHGNFGSRLEFVFIVTVLPEPF